MYVYLATASTYSYNNSGHAIRVFLTGDYEFLCRMYGLSGASGKITNLKKELKL